MIRGGKNEARIQLEVGELNGEPIEEALLGLATTRDLIEELSARAEIHGYAGYRTVDGD